MSRNRAGIALVVFVAIIGIYGAFTAGILTQPAYVTQNNPTEQIGNSIESGKQVLGNMIEKTTGIINPKPPPAKKELYQYALRVVNEDRKTHGVGPVVLSNIESAQNHADDMLNSGYFSHWNTDGVKPYATYTKLEGRGEVDENISYVMAHCLAANCFANSFDPFKEINDTEYSMMYDDASSNWGHRDNIINPDHTRVNFGIAYNSQRFYFVEHFENDIVDWKITQLNGNQLHLVGQIPSGYLLDHIEVFLDPSPKPLSSEDLNGMPPYNAGYYDQGELAGVILPQLTGNYY